MKNKIMLVLFTTALFSSGAILAASDVAKKPVSNKSISSLSERTNALEKQVHALKSQLALMQSPSGEQSDNNQFKTIMEMYAHGPAVVTSPVFGLRGPSDNYELMVNLSWINKDLYLLKLRQKMDDYAVENGIPIPRGPVMVLSGGVEGQVVYNNNYEYSRNSKTDINLTSAELDIVGEVGPWATGAMIINYDDGDTKSSGGSVARSNNSRLRLDRAWITLGQLNKCPLYFSIGQLFAPFGRYDSFMVTTPSTRALGRVKDRMAILGFAKDGFYTQIYGFSGETKKDTSKEFARHGGFNVDYIYGRDNFGMHVGGGLLGNLAESQGMQDILGKSKSGASTSAERIKSGVFGYNGHVKFDIYDFDLMAEYVGASKAFDSADLAFNSSGAKPWALDAEGAYSFRIKGKLNTVFVGYNQTGQALGLNLPKRSYFAGYSIALIKNVLASVEYRHDTNYSWSDTAASTNGTVGASDVTKGRHSNTVTMQLGVYF
ncbi:MAG: hypothetical protein ACD_21C00243G0002 [uncultured bacterium]|nr:MAG: hypothetical protein ACD_21C00243G0002 [uncultured bacterium]